jgi:acetyl esterase/lipase
VTLDVAALRSADTHDRLCRRIAALACLVLRERGDAGMLAAQVMVCPNTDLTGRQPSVTEQGSGFGPRAADLRWAAAQWVPDVARHADGDVSPLHARDLSGLPAAVVVTAEHDPLRDEGDLFAARLATAGVQVVHRCEPGLPHGFVQGWTERRRSPLRPSSGSSPTCAPPCDRRRTRRAPRRPDRYRGPRDAARR